MAVAKQQGFDETTAERVSHFRVEELPAHHVAALRLADALMTDPAGISAQLRDELRTHFTDEQILELTLDVMKWNYQKVMVALGNDPEMRAGQLTDIAFDEQGNFGFA